MLNGYWPSVADYLQSPVWEILALSFGLMIGSFANVCIHRIPRGESPIAPRSRCPACGHAITALENIPLVSFLFLRGRCRGCGVRISWRYPLVEALNGGGYLLVALLVGPHPYAPVAMVFLTALLILSLIDLEHYILPDVITLPGIALGIAASFLPGSPISPLTSVASAVGGYVGFWCFAWAFRRLRGIEGLGQGDWKMAAMLGAFLGWEKLLLTIFFASLAGTVVGLTLIAIQGGTMQRKLPLGTFLALAGAGALLAGDPLLAWYKAFGYV
jgi:leader peptidase (prepilin peptidase) / N-methyltransferase